MSPLKTKFDPNNELQILKQFWNTAPHGFLIFDSNLKLIDVNRASMKRIGRKKKDIIGKHISFLSPDLKNRKRLSPYQNVIKTGKPYHIPKTQHNIKKYKYVQVDAFKIGEGLGIVVTDISQKHILEEKLGDSYSRMQELASHLQNLREMESQRIAREIHDELAPTLTAFKMDLFWLLSIIDGNLSSKNPVTKKMNSLINLTDSTVAALQNICSELRPVLLDDLGLFPAIEWQIQEFKKRSGIDVSSNIECRKLELDKNLSVCIFRIFQEALTNVMRHANATKTSISIKRLPKRNILQLKVSDNGRGIPEQAIHHPKSFGLIGMRERLMPFKGKLSIAGKDGQGTTLTATIPISSNPAESQDKPLKS